MSSKQFYNDPTTSVEEATSGFLLQRPDLRRVAGTNSVILKNIDKNIAHIVSGGGSGHEPAHASFVQAGVLSACVSGGVFASPSHAQILTTLKEFAGCKKGVLVLIKNYQGDVINFSLACKVATELLQIPIEPLVFGDDVAFSDAASQEVVGNSKRGVAGTTLCYKILGHMAKEQGAPLDDLIFHASQMKMRSFSCIFQSCYLPGKSKPNAELGESEAEFGGGIHGESGAERVSKVPSAAQVAELLVSKAIGDNSEKEHGEEEEQEVVLALNNLGGVTNLEMSVLAFNVLAAFDKQQKKSTNNKKKKIARFISGGWMTSLNMVGVSLTALFVPPPTKTSEIFLDALDAPFIGGIAWSCAKVDCDAISSDPNYNSSFSSSSSTTSATAVASSSSSSSSATSSSSSGSGSASSSSFSVSEEQIQAVLAQEIGPEGKQLRKSLIKMFETLIQKADYFDELDSKVGDGDAGAACSRGSKGCLAVLLAKGEEGEERKIDFSADTKKALAELGSTYADKSGGSSGPLIGALFSFGAAALPNANAVDNYYPHFVKAVRAGVDAVKQLGKAQVGDRTMVDVLEPVCSSLLEHTALCVGTGVSVVPSALDGSFKAATKASQQVSKLEAKLGRSRYLKEKVVGEKDPGCEILVVALEALSKSVQ